jgi:hydrogenase maturation protease
MMNSLATNSDAERAGKTLILGLGNELRGDDAVGILAVEELRRRLGPRDDLVFESASVGGLALLDLVRGYRGLIVIDAIQNEQGAPGSIRRLSLEDLPETGSVWSAHGMGLRTVLETGRTCGCRIPEQVTLYAVEVADASRWHRGCSEEVRRAAGTLVERIMIAELGGPDGCNGESEGENE